MPTPSPSQSDKPQPVSFFSWQTLYRIFRMLGTLLTLVLRLWLMLQPGGPSFPSAPKSSSSTRSDVHGPDKHKG